MKRRADPIGYQKFSEVDTILMGMHLNEYTQHFERHKISLDQFLALNETDLEKMGIAEVS